MTTDQSNPFLHGYALDEHQLEILSTPHERLITLRDEKLLEKVVVESGTTRYTLRKLSPKTEEWVRLSLKHPIKVRPGIRYCNVAFETVEDAALFKLFWC